MATLSRLGTASRSRTGELQEVRNQSLRDLQEIVAALQLRDPQAASQAMQNHLINIHKRFHENSDNEANG
jgi:DNA-binding FadR family transcriptional regulator